MIQVVWQYEVKEESRGKFELAYGPGGAWSTLFAKAPGYRGTALLRDTEEPRKYLTIDAWDTEDQSSGFSASTGKITRPWTPGSASSSSLKPG